jgi:LPXTG-motif cell wall-anchored protein
MLFGFLLFVAGISDQEARAAIVIGLIFMGLGILLFRKKKKLKAKERIEPISLEEQPDKIKQSRKEKTYKDTILSANIVSLAKRGTGMATCKRCGKSGFFHKVNERGLCLDCARIEALELEARKIQEEINNFKTLRAADETAYNEIKEKKEILYNKIAEKAKKDALNQIIDQIDNGNKELQRLNNCLEDLKKEIVQKHNDIIVLDENIMLETFALYKPKFKFLTSNEYKIRLDNIRDKQKELIKNNVAVTANEGWEVNGSASEGKKMVNDMKKLLLRSFNNECDYCIDSVKFNNIEANEKRIEKSYEQCNKLGRIMHAEISSSYKGLKYDELYLAYEYQRKKAEEKEELRRAREEIREQQKLEREIREAREKIAKEKKHFTTAIKEFEEKLKNVTDEKERELIEKNLSEAKGQLSELDKEEKVVDYREQNAKAGYVYVISNIGAFGEGVYKIGMTRRLEPMDRIDELGDASVPFSFDVHALIFSDNAPALESKLHEYFYNNRINKINDRKEFFKADINEIERVVKENYNKIADVVKEAPAEQYRESLLL